MKTRILTSVMKFSSVLLCIVFSFCGCTEKPEQPMRVGISKWTGYEPLYLAREKNYFNNKDIKLVNYTSVTESARAFRNGAIDATANTLDEAIKLRSVGIDLKIVSVLDVSNGGDVILAQPEFKSLQELKKKRIGVETTSLGDYIISRALEIEGMTQSDISVVSLDTSEHERAFREQRVDAVVTYEPVKTKLLKAGANKVFDSSQIPDEIFDVLIVNSSFLKDHKKKVEKLVTGWFRALKDLDARNETAIRIMAEREGISETEFLNSLGGLKFPGQTENSNGFSGTDGIYQASAVRLAERMRKAGLLKRNVDISTLLDASFVREIPQ